MVGITTVAEFKTSKNWEARLDFVEKLWQRDSLLQGGLLAIFRRGSEGIPKQQALVLLQDFNKETKDSRMNIWAVGVCTGVGAIASFGIALATGATASVLGLLVATVAAVASAILGVATYDAFKICNMAQRVSNVVEEFIQALKQGKLDSVWNTSVEQRINWSREFKEVKEDSKNLLLVSFIQGKHEPAPLPRRPHNVLPH